MADEETSSSQEFQAGRIKVRVVTPDRVLIATDATSITLPGEAGVLSAGPGSTPQLTAVGAGELIVTGGESGEKKLVVARGFAEILPDRVSVLVEYAQEPEKVDKGEAEQLLTEGQKAEQDAGQDPARFAAARRMVLEAEAKLGKAAQ